MTPSKAQSIRGVMHRLSFCSLASFVMCPTQERCALFEVYSWRELGPFAPIRESVRALMRASTMTTMMMMTSRHRYDIE